MLNKLDDKHVTIDAKMSPWIWFPTLMPALTPLNIVTSIGDHLIHEHQEQDQNSSLQETS